MKSMADFPCTLARLTRWRWQCVFEEVKTCTSQTYSVLSLLLTVKLVCGVWQWKSFLGRYSGMKGYPTQHWVCRHLSISQQRNCWQSLAVEKNHSPVGIWHLGGYPCPWGRTHTYVLISSTNWTQGANDNN